MATPSGFDPPISTLTGWHVRPLPPGAPYPLILAGHPLPGKTIRLVHVTLGHQDHPARVLPAAARIRHERPTAADQRHPFDAWSKRREHYRVHVQVRECHCGD